MILFCLNLKEASFLGRQLLPQRLLQLLPVSVSIAPPSVLMLRKHVVVGTFSRLRDCGLLFSSCRRKSATGCVHSLLGLGQASRFQVLVNFFLL